MWTRVKQLSGSALATIFGIATSLATAYATIDWDTIDFHQVKTYFKLAVIGLPALGGYMSTLNKPTKK